LRALAALFLLVLLLPQVGAVTYTLPGELPNGLTYNNVGLVGELMVNLSVTLVNTAPYPRYVVVNPRYDFRVIREDGTEYLYNYRTADGELVGVVSKDLLSRSVNYMMGFWVAPYETVRVDFSITQNSSYEVPLLDVNAPCAPHVIEVTYYNGTLSSVVINNDYDIGTLLCGPVYPQLLNAPMVMSVRSMFPLLDRSVKILEYEGVVDFRITNVPSYNSDDKLFRTFFAVAQPVIFTGAETYDYRPNYTTTYSRYLELFLPVKKRPERRVELPENNLFQLTDTLISGVSIPGVVVERKPLAPDFPVWVVFMTDRVDITYRVSWSAGR